MIDFKFSIGGKQYQIETTDRKLFAVLNEFDDRVGEMFSLGAEQAQEVFSKVLNPKAILSDEKLAPIDRFLNSHGIPGLVDNASIQECVDFFVALVKTAQDGLTGVPN